MADGNQKEGRAQQILEQRNRAFRVLYDTVLEVTKATLEEVYAILCHSLYALCEAEAVIFVSYNAGTGKSTIQVYETPDEQEDVSRWQYVYDLPGDAYDRIAVSDITACDPNDQLLQQLIDPDFLEQFSVSRDQDWHVMTCVQNGELLAYALVAHRRGAVLKLKDMISTFLGLATVIVQRYTDVRKMRESNDRFMSLMISAPIGIMLIDEDNRIVEVNPAALQLFGRRREDVVDKRCFDFICPEHEGVCPFFQAGENAGQAERTLRRPDGSEIPILKSVTPIQLSGETFLLETFVDISQWKEAEQQINVAKQKAEHASLMKSQFLSNISHEIRTPLHCIMGFSENIMHADTMDAVRKDAAIILQESETLLALINDILDHAKIEAGKMELKNESTDLRTFLEGIRESMLVHAQAKDIAFELVVQNDVPRYVIVDPLRLRQIIANLIVNAIKFTPKGSVTLHVAQDRVDGDETFIAFRVIDTGLGIPKEKQKYIFDSFVQVDGSVTRQFGGTGLGTTIAHQLVEQMGGQMQVESTVGKGSTFSFTIPLVVDTERADDVVPRDTDAGRETVAGSIQGRVLVVEDYPTSQMIMQTSLEAIGATVEIVNNGREAVAACQHETYDLIYMDIQMPEMDGIEATEHIRANSAHCQKVPIIGMTANADAETRKKCLAAGMNDIITKPARRKKLYQSLKQWISA